MMKTLFRTSLVLCLFFCSSFSLGAKSVNPEKARSLASTFLGKKIELNQTKTSTTSPFYIFNAENNGGFAIIAGDDSVEPVIGYSESGCFVIDGAPDNVKWWFGLWEQLIESNISKGVQATSEIQSKWTALENGQIKAAASPSKLLTTATWGQGSPYNLECPAFGGATSVTGCVATAAAIVMRYFKYPEKGVGTLPSYSYTFKGETRQISGYSLGAKYDWENMPLEYSTTSTTVQQSAVAKLMHDVGVMVQMEYDSSGSAAYTGMLVPMLKKYMGYDLSSQIYFFEDYKLSEWSNLMKESIDNVGPAIYSGSSPEGGHAFVVDGYDASGRFHINFGWQGTDNGYYAVGSFKDFTNSQSFIQIRPDQGGKSCQYLSICSYDGSKGLSCDTDSFAPGKKIKVTCDRIANFGYEDFCGVSALARISKDGQIKEIISQNDLVLASWFVMKQTYEGSFTDIAIGDYMTVVTKSKDSDEWIITHYDKTDTELVAVIPLADKESIEEATSMKYTVSTGLLLVTTKKDATWTLTASSGESAAGAASWEVTEKGFGLLSISSQKLSKGEYILVLSKGSDTKTLKFTLGSKQ